MFIWEINHLNLMFLKNTDVRKCFRIITSVCNKQNVLFLHVTKTEILCSLCDVGFCLCRLVQLCLSRSGVWAVCLFVVFAPVTLSHLSACHCHTDFAVTYASFLTLRLTGPLPWWIQRMLEQITPRPLRSSEWHSECHSHVLCSFHVLHASYCPVCCT